MSVAVFFIALNLVHAQFAEGRYPVNQYAPQNDQQSFYYYPDANVYYDNSCQHYIYNNGAGWQTVNALPYGLLPAASSRVLVYHNGPKVWLDNSMHRDNYYAQYHFRRQQPVVAYRENERRGDRNWNRRDDSRDWKHNEHEWDRDHYHH